MNRKIGDPVEMTDDMQRGKNRATIERDQEIQERKTEEAKKNSNFTQLDDVGMSALKRVFIESPKAGNLFLSICPYMDQRGSLVISRQVLAEIAGVKVNNVNRLVNMLVDYGLIRKIKSHGMPTLAFNPDVVWRSWNSGKQYAMFYATVVMDANDVESGEDFDARRANALLDKVKKAKGNSKTNNQPELDPPVGREQENLEVVDE